MIEKSKLADWVTRCQDLERQLQLERKKRKQVEQKLYKQKKILDHFLYCLPDFIAVYDLSTKEYILHNRFIYEHLGHTEAEWQAIRANRVHPDDKQKVREAIQKIKYVKDKETIHVLYRLQHKTGDWRWMNSRTLVFERDQCGQPVQIMEIVQDITGFKQTELKLQQSENLYQSIAQNIPSSLIVVFDHNLNFILAEGSLLKQHGLTRQDIEDSSVFDQVKQIHSWQSLIPDFKQALSGQNAYKEFKYNSRNYVITVLPLTSPDKVGYAGMAIIQDITSRKAIENDLAVKVSELAEKNEELKKYITVNKELEQFAYIAAHDLKEPLRSIVSFSQILEHRYIKQLDESANLYFQYIINATKRMYLLVDGLLSYSQINHKPNNFEWVAVQDVIQKVMEDLYGLISEREAIITYESALPIIQADAMKLKMLLQNIIHNAIKFCLSTTPIINIQIEELAAHWKFAITDNGIGIAPDHFEQIFSMFKQLSSEDKHLSAGIGLTLTKKLVQQHKGNIWVKSVVNEGSTFYFTIAKNLGMKQLETV